MTDELTEAHDRELEDHFDSMISTPGLYIWLGYYAHSGGYYISDRAAFVDRFPAPTENIMAASDFDNELYRALRDAGLSLESAFTASLQYG